MTVIRKVAGILRHFASGHAELSVTDAADEGHRGIGTIVVAVADPATGEMASACITYPAAVVGAAERQRISALLTAGARRLGTDLGDTAWAAPPRPRKIA